MQSIPYGRQTITAADIAAVQTVLTSPFLTQGPVVPSFEAAVAARVGAAHAIAVNSATSALHLACLALGLGPGKRLWTSPITFVASANCARYCGAEVGFVDIEPSTGLMDPEQLGAQLAAADHTGTLPDVIVPVHLCGTSCAMEPIAELASRYGIQLIEDASHAIGASYAGRPVGSCEHSDISVFSFHPVKIITTGEGGMATTNNPKFAERMARLRSHGIERNQACFQHPAPGPWAYEQQELGFNYRLTELQAALGLSQLERLEAIVAERNRQLHRYRDLMADLPLRFLVIPAECNSSLHLAVIRLIDPLPGEHRRVFEGLRAAGVGVQLHYSPVHLQPYYRQLGWKPGDFPAAEAYAGSALSLPLFPGLSDDDQQRVAASLHNLL